MVTQPSVLHVSQAAIPGVARVVADLAADQVARGWRPVVASPSDGPLGGWALDAGARYEDWAAEREPGPGVAGEVRRLRALIERIDPDIVHLHSSKAGLCGRIAVRGRRPTIFQPHGWSFWAVGGAKRLLATRWERLAARWAHRVVCVSRGELDAGVTAGISARWTVVPNAVDLAKHPAAGPDERRRARERLGLGDEPLVVCVGRLSVQKGQDVLLDAWPRVRASVEGASLMLVGDGPARDELAARAVPGTRITGWREDVPDWLAAADVVALPSRWEGMSLLLLEAMASARCVVATDVQGSREAVGDDERDRAGMIVPPDDPVALAEAIAARLIDRRLREDEGLAGRRRAERAHDIRAWRETMAGLTLELLP